MKNKKTIRKRYNKGSSKRANYVKAGNVSVASGRAQPEKREKDKVTQPGGPGPGFSVEEEKKSREQDEKDAAAEQRKRLLEDRKRKQAAEDAAEKRKAAAEARLEAEEKRKAEEAARKAAEAKAKEEEEAEAKRKEEEAEAKRIAALQQKENERIRDEEDRKPPEEDEDDIGDEGDEDDDDAGDEGDEGEEEKEKEETPPPSVGTAAGQKERQERAGRTAKQMEDIASGKVSLEDIGAEAKAAQVEGAKKDELMTGDGTFIEADDAAMQGEDYQAEVDTKETTTTETADTVEEQEKIKARTYEAFESEQAPKVKKVIGTLSEESKAKLIDEVSLTSPAEAQQIVDSVAKAAQAVDVEGVLSSGAFAKKVTGLKVQVNETPDAEKQEREVILGKPAQGIEAKIVDTIGYEAYTQRRVKGQAAKSAAADMIVQTSDMPPEIAAAIVEDPATVDAQLDEQPVEVKAAIAALPTEALVSSQMESLLSGMEDGNIPACALFIAIGIAL